MVPEIEVGWRTGLIIRLSQEAKPEWMICTRLRWEIVDPRLAPP
jgi:hypothetical protein